MLGKNVPSTIITLLALLALAGALWAEKYEPKTWQGRLVLPGFTTEENRHTPIESNGIYLPPQITSNRILSAENGPILIANTVTVPVGVALTLEPGTHLLFHEYGELRIEGSLTSNGGKDNPVILSTNEAHRANQNWNGINIAATGNASLQNTVIRHASPGITCAPEASLDARLITIELGNLGIFNASNNCLISNSTIQYVIRGIVNVSNELHIRNTVINARLEDSQTF